MYKGKIEGYLESYKSEFGDKKYRSILNDIYSRKRFNSFITTTLKGVYMPQPDVFIHCVMNSPSYMFSSKFKVAVASLILLKRWDEEVNNAHIIKDEFFMNKTVDILIASCNKI